MSARVLGFRFWVLGYRFWEPESESSPLPRRRKRGRGVENEGLRYCQPGRDEGSCVGVRSGSSQRSDCATWQSWHPALRALCTSSSRRTAHISRLVCGFQPTALPEPWNLFRGGVARSCHSIDGPRPAAGFSRVHPFSPGVYARAAPGRPDSQHDAGGQDAQGGYGAPENMACGHRGARRHPRHISRGTPASRLRAFRLRALLTSHD
jgi:hypothetical protein